MPEAQGATFPTFKLEKKQNWQGIGHQNVSFTQEHLKKKIM